jgi:hypothetical protein
MILIASVLRLSIETISFIGIFSCKEEAEIHKKANSKNVPVISLCDY